MTGQEICWTCVIAVVAGALLRHFNLFALADILDKILGGKKPAPAPEPVTPAPVPAPTPELDLLKLLLSGAIKLPFFERPIGSLPPAELLEKEPAPSLTVPVTLHLQVSPVVETKPKE